jgi:hypothetical protein
MVAQRRQGTRTQDRLLIEAKAYSPPWFMTVSGDVAGAKEQSPAQPAPGSEAKFAEYPGGARCRAGEESPWHPVHQPFTPERTEHALLGFGETGRRATSSDPAGQSRMLLATAEALKAHGSEALLTAMDETNPATFVINWAGYTPQARAIVQN